MDFDKAEVQHILNQASDHSMILLDVISQNQRIKSRFIFNSRWCILCGCDKTVQNCWNLDVEGSKMFKFHRKVKNCRLELVEWRKKENLNSKAQIKVLKRRMEGMQEVGGQREWDNWSNLKAQLEEAYRDKEEYWARKARTEWQQRGDNSIKYYHAVTA